MSEGYKRKMGAMTFVAALFNEGVIPASVMHSCLAELLQGVRRRRRVQRGGPGEPPRPGLLGWRLVLS